MKIYRKSKQIPEVLKFEGRVTTCLENLEMLVKSLTFPWQLSNSLRVKEKILSGESYLSCMFASIHVFSTSTGMMIWVTVNTPSAANRQGNVKEFHTVWRVVTLLGNWRSRNWELYLYYLLSTLYSYERDASFCHSMTDDETLTCYLALPTAVLPAAVVLGRGTTAATSAAPIPLPSSDNLSVTCPPTNTIDVNLIIGGQTQTYFVDKRCQKSGKPSSVTPALRSMGDWGYVTGVTPSRMGWWDLGQ